MKVNFHPKQKNTLSPIEPCLLNLSFSKLRKFLLMISSSSFYMLYQRRFSNILINSSIDSIRKKSNHLLFLDLC